MNWSDIMDRFFALLFIFCLIMMVISTIGELSVSDWRRRMVEWLEGRVRDLEWERTSLQSDVRWIRIDLDHQRSRADYAEERNDRLSRENAELYRLLARRETGGNDNGAPAAAMTA